MNHSSTRDDLSSTRRSRGMRWAGPLVGLCALVGVTAEVRADPIPRGEHNRRLAIRLTPGAAVVTYQLDVEPFTAFVLDLSKRQRAEEYKKLVTDLDHYEAYLRVFARELPLQFDAT